MQLRIHAREPTKDVGLNEWKTVVHECKTDRVASGASGGSYLCSIRLQIRTCMSQDRRLQTCIWEGGRGVGGRGRGGGGERGRRVKKRGRKREGDKEGESDEGRKK